MSDLAEVRALVAAGAASLDASRARIDDLNVYPVPDGDTGTNMALTARSLVEALDDTSDVSRPELAHIVTRAALMGARGNSGVILSQIVRGAAEVLGAAGEIDSRVVAESLRRASDTAYRGVRQPVEGTILTVVRELAEEAEKGDAGEPVPDLLRRVLARGEDALARTPELLDVLREANVVDAGGAGLVEIVRGVVAHVTGEELPPPSSIPELGVEAVHRELSELRYCTAFLVEGDALDATALERELDALGDSLLVVGDEHALKVHVHTDDPGAALSLATARGAISAVEIADMHTQTVEREERLASVADEPLAGRLSDVVAVVAGSGNRQLYESLGAAWIVEGGQSMNPSAADILEAIDASPAAEVVVLPNNGNVIMSAEQAASLARKPARIVPTRSIQAGLSALLVYDPDVPAADNEAAMREAISSVATAAVTTASRDVDLDGRSIRQGQYLGLLEDEPLVGGESFAEVAEAVIEALLSTPHDTMTVLTGADAPEIGKLVDEVAARHPEIELDVQAGGQPHYQLLIAAE
ncbi:MAG TPA: DAK2 domain-containing protein [Gaiellaceae bacterium]|nr:DAK2 domain-containing protein [Gaiellaceae bacterium]